MLEVGKRRRKKKENSEGSDSEYSHLSGSKQFSRQSLKQNPAILGIVTNGHAENMSATHSKHRRDK